MIGVLFPQRPAQVKPKNRGEYRAVEADQRGAPQGGM
jgi:hypothetical protein